MYGDFSHLSLRQHLRGICVKVAQSDQGGLEDGASSTFQGPQVIKEHYEGILSSVDVDVGVSEGATFVHVCVCCTGVE